MTVTCKNVNVAILSVLECVLNQVDQNLLEASTVTFQNRQVPCHIKSLRFAALSFVLSRTSRSEPQSCLLMPSLLLKQLIYLLKDVHRIEILGSQFQAALPLDFLQVKHIFDESQDEIQFI